MTLVRRALTLVETLVVLLLFGIVTTALYSFFNHYSRSFITIDDRMESVVEAWQVLRKLGDDLRTADFPDGDPVRWREVLRNLPQGVEISCRRFDAVNGVTYQYDATRGDLTRSEGTVQERLLNRRCRDFQVRMQAEEIPNASQPRSLHFAVHLVLEKFPAGRDAAKPMVVDTIIIPEFLNRKLTRRYIHEGLPK